LSPYSPVSRVRCVGGNGQSSLGRVSVLLQVYLEFVLLIIIALVVASGIVVVVIQLVESLTLHSFGVNVRAITLNLVSVLYNILLLIIAVDIMRTIVVSIDERRLYVQAAVEAAALAIIRGIIGSELRHLEPMGILIYCVALAVVVGSMIAMGKMYKG